MSLIEKIDALEKYLVKNNSYFEGAEWLFGKVREAILSEQKESCEYCKWFSGMKAPLPEIEHKNEERIIYRSIEIKCCPMCGRPLNQPYTGS